MFSPTSQSRKYIRRKLLIAVSTSLIVLALSLCGWVSKAKTQHDLNMKLLGAVRKNDIATVRLLLARGADPNIRDVPQQSFSLWQQIRHAFHQDSQPVGDEKDVAKRTMLEIALEPNNIPIPDRPYVMDSENVPLVEALLEAGAHPDDSSSNQMTPLMTDVFKGWLRTVHALLEHGANPLTRGDAGRLPIHFLSPDFPDALEIAKLLMQRGNDVNSVDDEGDTLLMNVTYNRFHNNPEITPFKLVRFLVDHGANINARSNHRDSALLGAVSSFETDTTRFLLEHGAEVNVSDDDDHFPLGDAVDRSMLPEVEMLLEHGAKVDRVDTNGDTPLICSLQREECHDIVKVLIAHGADVNHRNKAGDTPLSLARKSRFMKSIRLLKAAGAKR